MMVIHRYPLEKFLRKNFLYVFLSIIMLLNGMPY
ncbi:Uncharacterised protein [Salmonella enterica subsp. houtenae]|nr:Uncharacterised protein [Salmonella enterica subsp. houtenae]